MSQRNFNNNLRMTTTSIYSVFCIFFCYIAIHDASPISCHNENIDGGILDISDDKHEPPRGKSIFFHETSCRTGNNYAIKINPRHACAVESAARLHPTYTVYLLYNSPIRRPNMTVLKSSIRNYNIFTRLSTYDNIKIRRLNFMKYTEGTPLEEWYRMGKLNTSLYPIIHSTDVLRYLTLWKYGGTYINLDVIVLKSLTNLGTNFAGGEAESRVNNVVLNLEPEHFGHKVANACVSEIRDNFIPHSTESNGPEVLTRVLNQVCPEVSADEHYCPDFGVLDPGLFSPLDSNNWHDYFDPLKFRQILHKVHNSYLIHLWNDNSKDTTPYGSTNKSTAYGYLASEFCPEVYRMMI